MRLLDVNSEGCDGVPRGRNSPSRGNNMKRIVDYLAEELKSAEPVIDYLAEEEACITRCSCCSVCLRGSQLSQLALVDATIATLWIV